MSDSDSDSDFDGFLESFAGFDFEEWHQEGVTECVCNKNNSEEEHVCRVFGIFECPDCDHTWTSGNSWYDFENCKALTQDCSWCEKACKPQKFKKLKMSNSPKRGPHQVDRCERCRDLGRDCSQ